MSFKSCSLFTHQEEEQQQDLIELFKFFLKTQYHCLTLSIWMLWPSKDQLFNVKLLCFKEFSPSILEFMSKSKLSNLHFQHIFYLISQPQLEVKE